MKNVIQLLPDDLASQVAAGEVVERPASVVKELVENSIDAGATHIEVSIQRGGLGLIRVQDNGCGMSPVDAETSLLRHATSKLRTSDDLSQILTMGFRGEAVPSIASVSQFRLVTKTRDAIEATEIAVQGGSEPIIKSASNTVGTIVEAKELFFNIPARRKFLKSERTEAAHVEHQIRVHALAKPEIRWLFRRDNKLVFDIPASKDIRARLSAIHGKDVASQLTRIDHYELHDCEVHGYMASLDFVRKSRKNQFFFINGRPVEDTVLTRSVREVFIDKLQEGEHPMVWLWITMPPDLVDVNVHPAKREIRLKTQDTSSVDTPNYTRPALQINSQFFRPKPTQENLLLSNASSNDPPNGSTPTTPEFITEAGSSSSKAKPISNLKLLTTLKDQYFLIETSGLRYDFRHLISS